MVYKVKAFKDVRDTENLFHLSHCQTAVSFSVRTAALKTRELHAEVGASPVKKVWPLACLKQKHN